MREIDEYITIHKVVESVAVFALCISKAPYVFFVSIIHIMAHDHWIYFAFLIYIAQLLDWEDV